MERQAQRALLLYHQHRYDLAESELRAGLSSEPDDSYSHALLSLCLCKLEKLNEGEKEAREAVRLAPDDGFSHYCLAHTYMMKHRLKPAEKSALDAVRLDPWSPQNFSLLGSIRLQVADWKGALDAATAGLELQADNVQCANVRSMALRNLGRREEALQTVDSALSVEPDNANTHSNKGWALLEAGNPTGALEHFREALRIDPNNAWARQGVVSALKARNPVYRALFNYFVWMSRLTRQARYTVVIGLWLLARFVLPEVSTKYPAASPFIGPVIVLYLVFCLTTWIADPLMNALIRFDKFGKYALTRKQKIASTWVCITFAVAAISLIAWLFHHNDGLLIIGFGYLFVTFLVAVTAMASSSKCGNNFRHSGPVSSLFLAIGLAVMP